MTSFFTPEVIVSSALIGVSVINIAGSLWVLRSPRDKRPKIDIDAAVRDAPYHLLAEIGIKVSSRS